MKEVKRYFCTVLLTRKDNLVRRSQQQQNQHDTTWLYPDGSAMNDYVGIPHRQLCRLGIPKCDETILLGNVSVWVHNYHSCAHTQTLTHKDSFTRNEEYNQHPRISHTGTKNTHTQLHTRHTSKNRKDTNSQIQMQPTQDIQMTEEQRRGIVVIVVAPAHANSQPK